MTKPPDAFTHPALTDPSRSGASPQTDAATRDDALPFRLRLRFRREQAGLRQWEVAEALEVHNTLLSAYENGRRRPADVDEFDLRHRQAILEAQRRRMTAALAESADGREVIMRRLTRESADACLDLLDALAQKLALPVQAELQPERGETTYRLSVHLAAPGATPPITVSSGPAQAEAPGKTHHVA